MSSLIKGIENNISYSVDTDKNNLISITVTNIKTNITKTKTYQCCWEPIFGYDAKDVEMVNEILDNLIKELS